jgi:hypothetical protein
MKLWKTFLSRSRSVKPKWAVSISTSRECASIEVSHGTEARRLRRATRLWNILWSEVDTMEIIQVVLDSKLLRATDRAARQTKRNRSALVRDALREHIRRLGIQTLEERDRKGYSEQPPTHDESLPWEAEAAWPAK